MDNINPVKPPADGTSFLKADLSIQCYTPQYKGYRMLAVFGIFVYPIGIPLYFLYSLGVWGFDGIKVSFGKDRYHTLRAGKACELNAVPLCAKQWGLELPIAPCQALALESEDWRDFPATCECLFDCHRLNMTKNADGSYRVTWSPPLSGEYTIALSLFGVSLPGSPFTVTVVPGDVDAKCTAAAAEIDAFSEFVQIDAKIDDHGARKPAQYVSTFTGLNYNG